MHIYTVGISLVEGICNIFIGVGLANKMFFQSSWQVPVLVKKADIEIRIFQIPRLWIWTNQQWLQSKSSTFVVFFVRLFVCVCMYLLKQSRSVVLGRRCEKENCSAKDHHARKRGALWVNSSLPAERPLLTVDGMLVSLVCGMLETKS